MPRARTAALAAICALVAFGMLLLPATVQAQPSLVQERASPDGVRIGLNAAIAENLRGGERTVSARPWTVSRNLTSAERFRLGPCPNVCGPEASPLFPRFPAHLAASPDARSPVFPRGSVGPALWNPPSGGAVGEAPPRDRGPPSP